MGKRPLIVALATLLAAGSARSADPQRESIDVTFQDCEADPIGESSFRRALGLELDQGLDPYAQRATSEGLPPKIDVKFRCDGLALIRIQLDNNNSQRRVRFDDVARSERARALALVVAELVRSGSLGSQSPSDTAERAASDAAFAEPAAAPTEGAAAAEKGPPPVAPPPRRAGSATNSAASDAPDTGVDARRAEPRSARRPRVRGAAMLRTSLGETGTHYGAGLGLDFHVFRLGAEGLFTRETRARGAISSGIAAVRVARGVRLVADGAFELQAMLSAAVGATWAVGQSEVAGSFVRDVLIPYGDARLGLAAGMHVEAGLAPELEVYAGRAAGILARADGEPTQATGGWFAGAEVGLSF